MPPSETRRAALIDKIADHILANGLGAASLRPMAEAAGTSDRMLLYYFDDKADIIAAALSVLAERLTGALSQMAGPPQPAETLRPQLFMMARTPGLQLFMSLWLEIAAAASRGDPAYAATGSALGHGFLEWISAQLDGSAPAGEAERIFAELEGLVLLNAVGMGDQIADALTKRDGS